MRILRASLTIFCSGLALQHGGFVLPQATHVVEESVGAHYTASFELPPPIDWPAGAEFQLRFDQTDHGEGYSLVLQPAGVCRFMRTQGRALQPIGTPGEFDPAVPIVGALQRRDSRMIAYIGGIRVASAQDAIYHGGNVGWHVSHEGLHVNEVLVQPIAPVEFTDDFVREGDSNGEWQQLAGHWQTVGVEGVRSRPDLSANPFALQASAPPDEPLALNAIGPWFWSDYRATTAVKAQTPGAIGVAVYVHDMHNFLLFRWTSTGEIREGIPVGRQQIVRVRDGQWDVLAEKPGGFFVDRWYEIGLAICDGVLRAEIDGRHVLTTVDTSFGQGPAGLFAQNAKVVYFDDVRVFSTRYCVNDFEAGMPGWWSPLSGEWSCLQGHLYGRIPTSRLAEAICGEADWQHYSVSALVKPKSAAAIGLSAYRRPDGGRYVFRWERNGRQILSITTATDDTLLAESRMPQDRARFYRLTLEVGHGRVCASVDDRLVLETAHIGLVNGPAGLIVIGPGEACFDDVSVNFDERRKPDYSVTAQFTHEETMQDWVDASRRWRKGEDGAFWYDMPLFGDFTLWLPPIDLIEAGGHLTAFITQSTNTDRNFRVEMHTEAGSPTVSAQIWRGDKAVAQGQANAASDDSLRVVREGSCVSVWLGTHPLVAHRDEAFAGRNLGLKIEGLPVDLAQTGISSPHLVDVTFSGAPTDWAPALGVWEITDRWPCAPGWSWFGGSRHLSPLLWSKDILEGDQVLEFWAGLLMDLPREPGYSHASDINAILCGDGVNLCSGYSFILAGDNNTKSKILRGNEVIAENPNVKFENPVSTNFNFHRHWFDIRIEKLGKHLTYSVDEQIVVEWEDPHVLAGGHVGFWSYQNNGILIARARMAAERIKR